MNYYKSIIITLVAVAVLLSSVFMIILIAKCKKFRDDVTFPLLISLFTAGLAQGTGCVMAAIISWLQLTDYQLLHQFCFFFMLFSLLVDYLSLTFLTGAKLIAVVKPFTFRSILTSTKVTVTVVTIWSVCVILSTPVLFYHNIVKSNNITHLPQFRRDLKVAKIIGLYTMQPLLYGSLFLLFVTSAALFVVAMKHTIRIQRMKRRPQPEGVEGQQVKVILMSLWAAKGIMAVSLLRLSVHLPFFVIKRRLSSTEKAFYLEWWLLSGPIWDGLCFVGCSKTLRHVVWRILRCKFRDNQVVPT